MELQLCNGYRDSVIMCFVHLSAAALILQGGGDVSGFQQKMASGLELTMNVFKLRLVHTLVLEW